MKRILTLMILVCAFQFSHAQYPLVSIHDIEYTPDSALMNNLDTSAYYGDTVQVEGVVTFNPCDYGLSSTGSRVGTFLEDTAGGPWSGIHVLIDPGALGYSGSLQDLDNDVQFINNFGVGNRVKCTGIINSFGLNSATPVPGNTQLLLLPTPSAITGLSSVPAAPVLTVDQFEQSDGAGGQIIQRTTGEQWEGVYVELDYVTVTDVSYGSGSSAGRVFWSVQDGAGNKLQVRDLSGWIRNDTSDNYCTSVGSNTPWNFDVTPGTVLSYLRGQIIEYCSSSTGCQYYISPRDTFDIGPASASPPVISNLQLSNAVPTTSQTQTVSATMTDIDGTVDSAMLYYSVGLGNQIYTALNMTQNGSIWSATIPAIATDSSYVNYWVRAFDNTGFHTNYPDSLATGTFYWVINSGINSIKDVQYNPTGSATPFLSGKWLSNMDVQGIVMSTTGFYDLGMVTIQDGDGAWHGIYLRGQNLSTLQRGDLIKITNAKVFENFNVTFLDSITYQVISNGNALYAPYAGISADSIHDGQFNSTEPYEGVLMGFNDMYVVNQNPDDPSNFGEWAVAADTADNIGMRCDDYSNDIGNDFNLDSLSLNQPLSYLYGILYYSFGEWKLLPRNRDDIAGYQTYTGIENDPMNQATVYCFPNPANDLLHVSIALAQAGRVSIELRDLKGTLMQNQIENVSAGPQEFNMNTSHRSDGMYLLTVRGNNFTWSGKVAIVK